MLRPSTARGSPALGMAASGRRVARRIRSMTVSTVAGPSEQLQPMTSAPHLVSRSAAISGVAPSRQLPSSSTVIITTMRRPGATWRAARMASPASASEVMVSTMSRSAPTPGPPSASAADLFGEGCAGLVEREFSLRRQRNAERADGPGDEGLGGLLLGNLRDALAGDADSGEVDLAHLVAAGRSAPGGRRLRRRCWSRRSARRPAGTRRGHRRRSPAARGSAHRSSG